MDQVLWHSLSNNEKEMKDLDEKIVKAQNTQDLRMHLAEGRRKGLLVPDDQKTGAASANGNVLNAYPRAEHTRLAEDHDNSRKKRRRLANGEMVLNLVANNHQAVTINHNHQGEPGDRDFSPNDNCILDVTQKRIPSAKPYRSRSASARIQTRMAFHKSQTNRGI
ncbi:Protein of unknown function [Pyronema omphalodes CBS 100304]|uniref:Uncharacterized protein n=1 Tax=Pyronema omphalodes (strain CBS 100304) TaxID=1076935 RepID=U4LMQ1_PYROM|nr:Protein of unknown function [Pyronema omphalodes CBS 100304]